MTGTVSRVNKRFEQKNNVKMLFSLSHFQITLNMHAHTKISTLIQYDKASANLDVLSHRNHK